MNQGRTYVQVDANAVNNGIMLLEASQGGGTTPGTITFWIDWVTSTEYSDVTGITGQGWFSTDTNGPWVETQYANAEDEVIDAYVKTQGNLDHILGDSAWSGKDGWVLSHWARLGTDPGGAGCSIQQ